MDGLQEALAYTKGKVAADTVARKRSLPDVDVARVRMDLKMTQRTFTHVLGVSSRTVEAWDGRGIPTPTARKLIFLIQEDHSLVQKL